MAMFQDSSGVACCLDWRKTNTNDNTNSSNRSNYCFNPKKDSSVRQLYDNALKSKDYTVYKTKSIGGIKKTSSSTCFIKCQQNLNQSSSQSSSLNYMLCKRPSVTSELNCNLRDTKSIWSGKFTRSLPSNNSHRQKSIVGRRKKRDNELVPAIKNNDFELRSPPCGVKNRSEKRCRKNYNCHQNQHKLEKVNSITLIKQKSNKYNDDFYEALNKVSNFYNQCSDDSDLCDNLFQYFKDRCNKKGHKHNHLPRQKVNFSPRLTQEKKCEHRKHDKLYYNKTYDYDEDDGNIDDGDRRTYKDPRLNELVKQFTKTKLNDYENDDIDQDNDENEENGYKKNRKSSVSCGCKNVKLCDVICHRCQKQLYQVMK